MRNHDQRHRSLRRRTFVPSWWGAPLAIPILVVLAGRPARAAIASVDDLPAPRSSSSADVEAARGLPIARVTIAGNRRVAAEDLAGYLTSLRPGRTFTPEAMARDVRELWDSGLVEDVEVDLATKDDGVVLRVLVRERPSVTAIDLSGNEAISADDLREAMASELKPGDVLSYAAVRRATEKLRDKYAEEGFYLAEVTSEIVPQKSGASRVVFRVREHEKLSVRRITFVGNRAVSSEELEEVMITGKGGILGALGLGTGGPFRRDAFERDLLMLNALYYDKGFLSVRIDTPRVMTSPDRGGIEISISIDEGPRYRIRRLDVAELDDDGHAIEPLGGRRHLREMIRAKVGDFFNRAELVKDLASVQTMYRDAGYALVEVPPATELDPDRQEVDIRVAVRRRRLVRIGRIEIHGNTKTRDKVIRREMELVEEGLFSETGMERSKRRIEALGFFERVDVSTSQGSDPDHLDVTVEIAEKPTGTFQVGAGFSSAESFLLNAQIQQNNLFGSGRSLGLNAQISGVRQIFDFHFTEPHLRDTPLSLSVSLYDQIRAYEQFSQASKGGSITLGYPLQAPHLYGSLTYALQQDRVDQTSASAHSHASTASSPLPRLPLANLFNDGITSSVRAMLTYDRRNNQIFPTSGMFLQGSVELASALLGSENQFLRSRATARFYQPLTADESVVLRFNGEAGLVTSPSSGGVPIFARFFLGGMPDVRGFPLRSLGPRLPLSASLDPGALAIAGGATIGGNLMYYQNLEIEFPILKAVGLRGVVFTDLGNIWNLEGQYCHAAPGARAAVIDPCFSPARLLDVRASWGFGLRWSSPLGPLRFEWGFPFKPLPYEQPRLFEFTIGSAF